jgi:phosphonatase-like hydrolase
MAKISMVMFDLSGTTVEDDMGVQECLYKAAVEFGLNASRDEILLNMGTNKIHLYQFLIARQQGRAIGIREFERIKDQETLDQATEIFNRYTELMIEHYKENTREITGASEVFMWCHDHGIKVATNTGFHRAVVNVLMDSLGWVKDGLVDIAVDVEHIPGEIGRPAPFMIFFAMTKLNIQSVHEVIKVGDTPADMLEGYNAGCRGVVGVLSSPRPVEAWGRYRHTHVIPSVAELPELILSEFM